MTHTKKVHDAIEYQRSLIKNASFWTLKELIKQGHKPATCHMILTVGNKLAIRDLMNSKQQEIKTDGGNQAQSELVSG